MQWKEVSPGSRPRPSLSEAAPRRVLDPVRVSPGSRPRPSLSASRRRSPRSIRSSVSPGSRPRPSLSVERGRLAGKRHPVSPGSRPRPSLSGREVERAWGRLGVSPGSRPRPSLSAVSLVPIPHALHVSPGSRPRPSLSEFRYSPARGCTEVCRRGLGPGRAQYVGKVCRAAEGGSARICLSVRRPCSGRTDTSLSEHLRDTPARHLWLRCSVRPQRGRWTDRTGYGVPLIVDNARFESRHALLQPQ